MKYQKKITYLGIHLLYKNFLFLYESERKTHILSNQVFDYTRQPFLDFSVIDWGVAGCDVIIYKVDGLLHYNEGKCYNFDTSFVTNV